MPIVGSEVQRCSDADAVAFVVDNDRAFAGIVAVEAYLYLA